MKQLTRILGAAILASLIGASGLRAQTVTIEPTGSITTNGQSVTFITGAFVRQPSVPGGFGSVAIGLSGTFTGTFQFEGSVDCSNYVALNATPPGSTTAVTSATATGTWVASVAGLQCVRVRASAAVTGTASVTIRGGGGGGASSGGAGGNAAASATGSSVPASADYTGFNSGGSLVGVSTANRLPVTCDNCGGGTGGTAALDGAAFTAGTSSATPGSGAFDDTASGTVTEDKLGIFRITTNRALHVNFRNASGTEIGTAATPIQVSLANTASNGTAVAVSLASVPSHAVTNAGTFATQAAQSGTWTVQPGNTANTTAWFVNPFPTAPAATTYLPVRIGDGTSFITPATDATHGSTASSTGPQLMGTAAVGLSAHTATTDGQSTKLAVDALGRTIVAGACDRTDRIGSVTTVTDGSSTSAIAAAGAGIYNEIWDAIIANTSASAVTVDIRDGTAGSVMATFPVPANTAGVVHRFAVPLTGTANTAVAVDPSAAASSIIVTLRGCKAK